jgi:tagatose 1,6-diphosphate aldolase
MDKRTLSIGKYRALQRASTPSYLFTIVALDHHDALRRALDPENPIGVSDQLMTQFKLDVMNGLSSEVSGVLVDPVYGAAQAIERGIVNGVGLLVELEKADYNMEPLPLVMEIRPHWSVAKIKRMYGDGVKVFFYYHPDDAEHASIQSDSVAKIAESCKSHDIPMYAEPIAYPAPSGPQAESVEYSQDITRVVVESAKRSAQLGADVLKLEFPVDINHEPDENAWLEACKLLSQSVDIPWVLLSAGADYEIFVRQVEIACKSGASGFIAGRAVWGDACAIQDAEARCHWLGDTGKMRIARLNRIVEQYGIPWTDHYQPESISTSWFKVYESGEK